VNYDSQNYNGRPTPDDLYVYSILRNDVDGSSVLNQNHFALWSMYVPPNHGLVDRYIVQWPVTMTLLSRAQQLSGIPQVGITLETWRNSLSGHLRTTTVNPFSSDLPGGTTEANWNPSASLGYIMTGCPD